MKSTLAIDGGTPVRQKPFPAWPVFDEREEEALLRVLHSGNWWQFAYGYGAELDDRPDAPRAEVSKFQDEFAALHGCSEGIAACNGTATLEISLRALGVGPGDEVLVPAYTFIASASCILQVGAVPVFIDIMPDTCNIDPARIEEAITKRTRAIIVVHFGGQAADMEAILPIALRHGLHVIEDAAHAHGGDFNGKPCGSLGDIASFSFQASKNMTSGEGGILTTNNAELAELCRSYLWGGRAKGRPWYEHHRLGGNYRITEFQAAILRVQLQRLEAQTKIRDVNGRYLAERLQNIPGLKPQTLDSRVSRLPFHLFMMRFDANVFGMSRERFRAALEAEGIPCSGGYAHPLFKNPMFVNKDFWKGGFPCVPEYAEAVNFADYEARCPVSEAVCNDSIWFVQNMLLGERTDMDDIVRAIEKVRDSVAA